MENFEKLFDLYPGLFETDFRETEHYRQMIQIEAAVSDVIKKLGSIDYSKNGTLAFTVKQFKELTGYTGRITSPKDVQFAVSNPQSTYKDAILHGTTLITTHKDSWDVRPLQFGELKMISNALDQVQKGGKPLICTLPDKLKEALENDPSFLQNLTDEIRAGEDGEKDGDEMDLGDGDKMDLGK